MKRFLWAIFSLVALCTSSSFAQKATQKIQALVEAQALKAAPSVHAIVLSGGGIQGSVKVPANADGSRPRAYVTAYTRTTKTAADVQADGTYAFEKLAPDQYYLYAWAEGALGQYYEHAKTQDTAKLLDVKEGETLKDINFSLASMTNGGGRIQGVVVAQKSGQAIADAIVTAYSTDGSQVAQTTTNTQGQYSLEGLSENNFYVQARTKEYPEVWYPNTRDINTATAIAVSANQTIVNINFKLSEGGVITGKVLDQRGKPIPNVYVQVQSTTADPSYFYSGYAQTDHEGVYRILGIPEGSYWVMVNAYNWGVYQWYPNVQDPRSATKVQVKPDESTTGIDFRLPVIAAYGQISGKITNLTDPQKAYLYLIPTDSTRTYYNSYNGLQADGSFSFKDVPVGHYKLGLSIYTGNGLYFTYWYDNTYNFHNAKTLVITENSPLTNITLQMPNLSAGIEGIVRDAKGSPIPNVGVSIQMENSAGGYVGAYTNTNELGQYRFSGLPEGKYQLFASGCMAWTCAQKWYPNAETPEQAVNLIVRTGETIQANLVLALEKGSAQISGQITDTTGQPLANAQIMLTWAKPVPNRYFNAYATTDAQGNYAIADLLPGEYLLYASYYGEGDLFGEAWYENGNTQETATPISLSVTEERGNTNLTLNPTPLYGVLTGTLALPNGEPIPNAYVELQFPTQKTTPYNRMMYWGKRYTYSDEKGRYQFESIMRGEYTLAVYGEGFSRFSGNATTAAQAKPFRIVGGETTVVDFNISPKRGTGTGMIAGKISSNYGYLDQNLAEPAVVTLINAETEETFTTLTDKTGAYTFSQIPDGAYVLGAFSGYAMPSYYRDAWDPSQANLITLKTGANILEGLDLTLRYMLYMMKDGLGVNGPNVKNGTANTANQSIISGKVTASNGKPLANANVYALDADGQPVSTSKTNANGEYTLADLQAGTNYRLYASKLGYKSRYHDGAQHFNTASPLNANKGETTLDFILTPNETTVPTDAETPKDFEMFGNFPNPFSEATTLRFRLEKTQTVRIEIFDLLGRKVETLTDQALAIGDHQVTWHAAQNAPGLYFWKMHVGSQILSGKMIRTQ